MSPISQSPTAPSAPIKAVNNQSGGSTTSASTAGSATSAVRNLVRSTQAVVGTALDRSESPLAALVGRQCSQELALAEIGPPRLGEVEFRIGELEEKKVGNPELARSPDQQVGIGQAGRVETRGERVLVDLIGSQRSRRDFACDSLGRAHEVLTPAVRKRQRD